MTIRKVLVTGSSGMIGTRLCEKLIENQYNIIGVDWKDNRWNKSIDSLTIKIDLRDLNKVLERAPRDIDLIIHLAANARVHNLVIDPSQALDNILLTFNILEFMRLYNVKRVIFASSREVYGNSSYHKHTEENVNIHNCESPYAASKMAGESLVWSYHRCYGIDFILFRFSNVYGMYDETDRVMPFFIRQALNGRELTVFGKEKIADFTYIDDTVDGIVKGIERFDESKNKVFNLAYGEGVSILKVAELIKHQLNSTSKIVIEKNRVGELMKYVADISEAHSVLYYTPKTKIEEGICKTIEWYIRNGIVKHPAVV